jgi:hypothetical protein
MIFHKKILLNQPKLPDPSSINDWAKGFATITKREVAKQ